jgi:hypothetical protein
MQKACKKPQTTDLETFQLLNQNEGLCNLRDRVK